MTFSTEAPGHASQAPGYKPEDLGAASAGTNRFAGVSTPRGSAYCLEITYTAAIRAKPVRKTRWCGLFGDVGGAQLERNPSMVSQFCKSDEWIIGDSDPRPYNMNHRWFYNDFTTVINLP